MKKLFKLKTNASLLFVCALVTGCITKTNTLITSNSYPPENERIVSKENITYFINPVSGSDKNIGTKKEAPWKTFKRVNQLILTKGNKVEILSSGTFRESLFLMGQGTKEEPIVVKFANGRYDFFPEKAFKRQFHISNTNDAPDSLKAIAFYLLDSKNININGSGAEIVFRGKVIEASLNNRENINIEDISFDYKCPTVSEMKVIDVHDLYSDVQIHKDSNYEIIDSALIWMGEGWRHKVQNYWQVFDSIEQKVTRKNIPIGKMRFSALAQNQVRIYHNENPGVKKGLVYQNRNTFRDYAGIFMRKSKNISWKNVNMEWVL